MSRIVDLPLTFRINDPDNRRILQIFQNVNLDKISDDEGSFEAQATNFWLDILSILSSDPRRGRYVFEDHDVVDSIINSLRVPSNRKHYWMIIWLFRDGLVNACNRLPLSNNQGNPSFINYDGSKSIIFDFLSSETCDLNDFMTVWELDNSQDKECIKFFASRVWNVDWREVINQAFIENRDNYLAFNLDVIVRRAIYEIEPMRGEEIITQLWRSDELEFRFRNNEREFDNLLNGTLDNWDELAIDIYNYDQDGYELREVETDGNDREYFFNDPIDNNNR